MKDLGTIYVKVPQSRLRKVFARASRIASGQATGAGDEKRKLLNRIGLAVLGRVWIAFIAKASGGIDETGLKWKPLSKRTVAYSRRHLKLDKEGKPKEGRYIPKSPQRARYAPSYMLTTAQRNRWWKLYRMFGGTSPKGKAYHKHNAPDFAAAVAWKILKSEGARTIMMVYGNEQVPILRDTDLLMNSVKPGIEPDQASTSIPNVKDQVFRLQRDRVIVGTKRLWAYTHHYGVPGRIPQRRLWPDPKNWTRSWWTDILEQAQKGMADIIKFLLK